MDWSGCEIVETVAGKVSGVPIVKGTRMPADAVIENFESGESVEDICFNFDLDPADVQQVLGYASAHQATQRAS